MWHWVWYMCLRQLQENCCVIEDCVIITSKFDCQSCAVLRGAVLSGAAIYSKRAAAIVWGLVMGDGCLHVVKRQGTFVLGPISNIALTIPVTSQNLGAIPRKSFAPTLLSFVRATSRQQCHKYYQYCSPIQSTETFVGVERLQKH
eukprot:scaffold94905_cov36-Cyclotella_meneghiniana.AAC.5